MAAVAGFPGTSGWGLPPASHQEHKRGSNVEVGGWTGFTKPIIVIHYIKESKRKT